MNSCEDTAYKRDDIDITEKTRKGPYMIQALKSKIQLVLKTNVQLDRKKGILGGFFAILALLVCLPYFSWHASLGFAVAFVAAGCLKLNISRRRWLALWYLAWAVILAITTFKTTFMVIVSSYTPSINTEREALNVLLVLVVIGVMFLLTANWKKSIFIGALLMFLFTLANGFIFQFRGKELSHPDFLSIATAVNVAAQYKPRIVPGMAWALVLWPLVAFCGFSLPRFTVVSKKRVRIFVALAILASVLVVGVKTSNTAPRSWEAEGTRINGYYLNFILGIRDSFVEKPENYDPDRLEGYAEEAVSVLGEQTQKKRPNVIVIMNESFVDFRAIGELNTNQPVMPFLDSLKKNTVRGFALSSVYGGKTANSEFEFLTGHSMAFLPKDAVPYQQYIRSNIYTLAHLMNSYGYKSIATHPYYANGWSRNRIYPYLGFSESTFIDSYPEDRKIRNYISDQATFEFVLDKLKNKEENTPLFVHCVTMQNHGGYDYVGENYEQTIELVGYEGEYPLAEQHLSMLHETDKAMEYLLKELESYSEDTVVLFFGDHYPKVESEFYDELLGGTFDTLSQQMKKHTVPFFVWANYNIEEEIVECTSLNYLSRYLLDAAGFDLPPYYHFLFNLERSIPAMNALGYYSLSQKDFLSYEAAPEAESALLNEYAILQYNNLFDIKNRNPIFYGQYLSPMQ